MERSGLRLARQCRGWTILQAAVKVEVGWSTWYRWERGLQDPRQDMVQRLCHLFGMSAAELDLIPRDNGLILGTALGITIMSENISSSLRQDLPMRLLNIVHFWPRKNFQPEELQGYIDQTVNEYEAIVEQDVDQVVTRRNALRSLVLSPIEFCSISAVVAKTSRLPIKRNIDDILAYCTAGIAAAWYLRKGKELALAFDAVSLYIPILRSIAESSVEQQSKTAASLLIQCYLLKAILARHLESNTHSVQYLQEAEKYTDMANNPMLSVLIPRTLSVTYNYANRWDLAGSAAELARDRLQIRSRTIPAIVQSFVYAGMANCASLNGKRDEAQQTLKLAHKMYSPSGTKDLPVWVIHNTANLIHYDAMTHYHLGMYQEAADSLDQIVTHTQTDAVMEQVERVLDRAKIEVYRDDQARDMELCINLLTRGTEGAKELQSEQRFTEARSIYSMVRAAWPLDSQVKGIQDLMVHW